MGVDISETMIEVARRHAADKYLPAEFHAADARETLNIDDTEVMMVADLAAEGDS